MQKSIFGLDEKHAAALSYVFTFVTGLPVLILEKDNKYVRFHAMQSTLLGLALLVLRFALGILSAIPLLGILAGIANWAIGVISVVAVIYLFLMALRGHEFKLPIIGDISWAQVNK